MNRRTYGALFLVLLFMASARAQSPGKSTFMLPTLYNDNGDGFIVIAHRGASAYYPENTMAAFRGAIEMNAEMIELDVLLSKDKVPVVFHDVLLDDHTNGSGELSDYTLKELKELDAGSWFGARFSGERIPTLEEVLEFASGKIALNIEIKTESVSDEVQGGVEEKSLNLVKKYGMEEHVLFSSFDYRAVRHLKELDPGIPVAILYEKGQSGKKTPSELISEYKADAFNCSFRQLNKQWIRDMKAGNIPLFIYTVNTRSRMKKLIGMGVTGIFSDKPDLLGEIVTELKLKTQD